MNQLQIYNFVFWAAIACVVFGGVLAIVGVWFEGFWKNDVVAKLFITDGILVVSSVVVAVILKWLGSA